MAKKVTFTRESAERIARSVRRSEGAQVPPTRRQRQYGGGGEFRVLIGKTDASHAKSASGTISIWDGTQGSETDTGQNVTAYNYFAAIGSGKWVAVVETVRGYIIIAAEC